MAHSTDPVHILPFSDQQARLVLNRRGAGHDGLDGGWWPRSRNARTQLPDLITGLNARYGTILRLAVSEPAWEDLPHQITMAGHVVRVERYTDVSHVIVVMVSHHERLQLLVIPPQVGARPAMTALAMSIHPSGLGAQEILEYCRIGTERMTRLSARPIASAA